MWQSEVSISMAADIHPIEWLVYTTAGTELPCSTVIHNGLALLADSQIEAEASIHWLDRSANAIATRAVTLHEAPKV